MAKVKDIMSENVIACTPALSVTEAAKLLTQNGFSGMPVVENDKVVGLLTEDDLLKIEKPIHIPAVVGFLGAVLYLDNPLNGDEVEKQIQETLATEVREVMSKDFKSVPMEMDIHELADLMIREKLSLVPVINQENALVGVVTKSDIIQLLAAE